MSKPIFISGLTIVRNALLLDYPFRESVESVLPLCDEFIINCGDSADGTEEFCKTLQQKYPDKIRIIHSLWEKEKTPQSGGFQLKHQTDLAIREAKGDWCFCIQADEVVHEEDLLPIRQAINKAQTRDNIDGIVFDYLHFYGSYRYTIRGRNWYRREVRVFKNHRGIEAFRDAQGFRKNGQRLSALYNGARIFHYGYVRSSESFQKKSNEMSRWWGVTEQKNEASITLHRHFGLSRFENTHPPLMAERLATHGDAFDPSKHSRKWDKNEFKNAVTLLWESIVPFRIGEFRNYNLVR